MANVFVINALIAAAIIFVFVLFRHREPLLNQTSAYTPRREWTGGNEPSAGLVPVSCKVENVALSTKKLPILCLASLVITPDMSVLQARANFYTHIYREGAVCTETTRIGRIGDGGWLVCSVGPYRFTPPCLIYSVGINNEWSFDDDASENYGCEVHAFDPTMGVDDHKHSDKVWFYNAGLGGRNYVTREGWNIKTLCSIVRELGHQDRIIDFLKFDIEYSEWSAIEAMLAEGCLKNVKQLSFEFHAWTDKESHRSEFFESTNDQAHAGFHTKQDTVNDFLYYWSVLQALEDAGFQKFMSATKGRYGVDESATLRYHSQGDMAYINLRFIEPV